MMFDLFKILSKSDCDFLTKNVDDAEKYIKEENMEDLFGAIEDVIVLQGFNKDGFYNELGQRMQDIHDNIIDAIDEYNESHKKTP